MDELAKIDLLRERLGITYSEAKAALDQQQGDVVQALIHLEKQKQHWDEKIEDNGKKIVEHIREIIKKGNVTKVRLKKGDKVVVEIPATIGALGVGGALLSTPLAIIGVIGTVAALINNYSLEIVRPDGKVEQQDLKFLTSGREEEEDPYK